MTVADIATCIVVVIAAWLWWHTRPKQSKRPGYISQRKGFGHGINHPTFREAGRGLREARRFNRRRY